MNGRQYSLMLVAAIVAGLLLVPINSSFGQEETIEFATGKLRLGMNKTQVLKQLESHYTLSKDKTPIDYWSITTKHGPPYDLIGGVQFIKDKLVTIQRDWGTFQGDSAYKFGRTLFSILTKLKEEGKHSAVFTTYSRHHPQRTTFLIDMYIGQKQISIGVYEDDQIVNQVSISEILMKEELK